MIHMVCCIRSHHNHVFGGLTDRRRRHMGWGGAGVIIHWCCCHQIRFGLQSNWTREFEIWMAIILNFKPKFGIGIRILRMMTWQGYRKRNLEWANYEWTDIRLHHPPNELHCVGEEMVSRPLCCCRSPPHLSNRRPSEWGKGPTMRRLLEVETFFFYRGEATPCTSRLWLCFLSLFLDPTAGWERAISMVAESCCKWCLTTSK